MSTIILRGFKRKIILALLLFITACDEQTEQKTITLAHGLDIQHPVHEAMLYMNDRLRQYSNDKMRLQIFASGQLGSEREVLELLQIGSVGMTKVSASSIEAFVPKMKVFSVPYLFTSQEHLWRILNGDYTDLNRPVRHIPTQEECGRRSKATAPRRGESARGNRA